MDYNNSQYNYTTNFYSAVPYSKPEKKGILLTGVILLFVYIFFNSFPYIFSPTSLGLGPAFAASIFTRLLSFILNTLPEMIMGVLLLKRDRRKKSWVIVFLINFILDFILALFPSMYFFLELDNTLIFILTFLMNILLYGILFALICDNIDVKNPKPEDKFHADSPKKVIYLVLFIILVLISFIMQMMATYDFRYKLNYIILFLAFSFIAAWGVNPYKKGNIPILYNNERLDYILDVKMERTVLLSVLTFGIWNLMWVYKATKFTNQTRGLERRSIIKNVILSMFVPFYSIYWAHKTAQRLEMMAKERNLKFEIDTYMILISIFANNAIPIFAQEKINDIIKVEYNPNLMNMNNNYNFINNYNYNQNSYYN